MVMEASPSPQSVGREFVRQYYTLLNKAPTHLHRFYNNYSSFVHGGLDAPNRETLPVVGQKQIHNRIQQLNFRDCHAKISQVDAQATLGNGVVVQVTGELSNGGAPMRRFTQTFVLAAQSPKKYYVHNDIFRYQDVVFSDEEGEGSGRSEGEEEEAAPPAGNYYPPAPPASAFPPASFPAPPAAPAPAPASASAAAPALAPAPPVAPSSPTPAPAPAPHLNGLPTLDDNTRHLVAALHGPATVEAEPEPQQPQPQPQLASLPTPPAPAPADPLPEPEPEREPTPPPAPSTPAAAPEPKTYANLLKSGSGGARVSPPACAASPAPAGAPAPSAAAAPASAAAPGPGPAPATRAHSPRPSRPHHAASADPRRYSDAQQLFLGNLPHSATEEELRALFARFGPVAELRVHSKAGPQPNYGFITYESAQAALACLCAAPLFFPAAGPDAVKLNVEEKKTRGREPPRRRPLSSQRAFQPRLPYRR